MSTSCGLRCLVISDSHGSIFFMRRALERCGRVDAVIFLGDGLSDAEAVADSVNIPGQPCVPWFVVRGNCDMRSTFLGRSVTKTETIALGERRIVCTHGDLYGVKYHMAGLEQLAAETNADIVLFGHTHAPMERYSDGVYYFNPGALRDGCCGVLSIRHDGVLFSHIELLRHEEKTLF